MNGNYYEYISGILPLSPQRWEEQETNEVGPIAHTLGPAEGQAQGSSPLVLTTISVEWFRGERGDRGREKTTPGPVSKSSWRMESFRRPPLTLTRLGTAEGWMPSDGGGAFLFLRAWRRASGETLH